MVFKFFSAYFTMKESIEDFPMEVPTVPVSTASEGPSGSTSSCNSALLHPGGIVNTSCISTENMVGMDFDIAEYHSEAMNVMHDLFLSGALTDVTLIVEANQIRCHRIVLVGASPYFRAMFCTNMRESEMAQIELHCISTTALRKLVEFAYTGKIRIDEHNVCELLTASSMVQMNHVIEACCTFLEHQLHASNVIGICEFATSNSCTGLALAAQTFLDQNFNEVVKYDEFLALTPTQLFSMIKRDNLSVRTEAEVYNAMIRWINHDRSSRLSLLLDALYVVRCHTLSPNFIRSQIKNCSLLAGVPSAKMHLQSVLRDLVEHRHVLMKRRTAGSSEVNYSVLLSILLFTFDYLRLTFPKTCASIGNISSQVTDDAT